MNASISIPIYCPTCRALYPYQGVVISGGASVTMTNVGTDCPKGHAAKFLDATYGVKDGALSVKTDSYETIRILRHARKIAEEAISGKRDSREAADQIADLIPDLAPVLKAASGGSKSDLIVLVALALWFIIEILKLSQGATTNTTIINNISVQQSVAKDAWLPEPKHGVSADDQNHSKRKARRLRGRQKEIMRSI